ncbi:MAG: hypothetical protein FWF84_01170 [Kiritimatiellaeota bacterium]|nr:hypothetical protein [Kiritimatiellota bacterium]
MKKRLGVTVLMTAASMMAETMEFMAVETAGMSSFRALWDVPIVTAEDGVRFIDDEVVRDRGGTAPFAVAWRTREREVKPAALAFDAMHRMLLVRFPGAAEGIVEKLNKGYDIEKVELVLPFLDEELWPEGGEDAYQFHNGAVWGVPQAYRAIRPVWHAVAYALMKPWKADPVTGPTYNAYINGAGYWEKYGAQGETDRMGMRFGPTPVNYENTEGRMDITAALTGFGGLRDGLRRLSDCGFLIRKWERYDSLYHQGGYEWATGTGPRAIIIKNPKLVVTFSGAMPRENSEPRTQNSEGKRIASGGKIDLPPAADFALLTTDHCPLTTGFPTAVMPTLEELGEMEKRFAYRKPADMEAWQWARVQELFALAYGENAAHEPFWYEYVADHIRQRVRSQTEDADEQKVRLYAYFINDVLRLHRSWWGYDARDKLTMWFMYKEALPKPVQEHFLDYWVDWLMPDRETATNVLDAQDFSGAITHPQLHGTGRNIVEEGQLDPYWVATKDWRGNKSYYRGGYTRRMSTVGFNNLASMTATLAGGIIGSENALEDGRYGLNTYTLKTWSWGDGTTQEEGDDFYGAIAITPQKMMADFGSTLLDRLLGKSAMLKSMTVVADNYHHGLRRYVAGSSRTTIYHRLIIQEGLYSILHTLSKKGAFADLGQPRESLPLLFKDDTKFGHDGPPDMIARASASGAFAPTWYQQIIDEKRFPYEVKAAATLFGQHAAHPILIDNYLGHNYGLHTSSIDFGTITSYMIWKRKPEMVETSRDFVTVVLRGGTGDETVLIHEEHYLKYAVQAAVQSKNKAVITFTPGGEVGLNLERGVTGFQASMGFYNHELPAPTWEIYIDGEKVTDFPAECAPGQVIAIKDGVTFMGIIPLKGSVHDGGGKVVLKTNVAQRYQNQEEGRYNATLALVIDNIVCRHDTPFETEEALATIANASTGFAVELADVHDYPDFAAFLAHLKTVTVTSTVDEAKGVHDIAYASGGDTLEMSVNTTATNRGETRANTFYNKRLVNGESPDLPPGIDRISPFSLQSKTGTLELGGNTLAVTPGALALLQVAPVDGTLLAVNPLMDLTDFALKTHDGIEVTANGKVGILFLTLDRTAKTLTVEHAFTPDQAASPAAATALTVQNLPAPYTTTYNNTPLQTPRISLK